MKKCALHKMVWMLLIWLVAACNPKSVQEHAGHSAEKEQVVYTCPMHPEITKTRPGSCPICGMNLVKKDAGVTVTERTDLVSTPGFVLSTLPVIAMEQRAEEMELDVVGRITYDPRQTAAIAARVNGRIERLYVRYKYQPVKKGQRVMDIYSPELITAQQNLIFLLRNDPGNVSLLQAAKDRLILMGMSTGQVAQLTRTKQPLYSIPVFSPYSGFVTEFSAPVNGSPQNSMEPQPAAGQELSVREGMYVQSGQSVFSVYNPARAWVVLDIFPEQQSLVQVGDPVRVVPETAPHLGFRERIDYMEPLFRQGAKTLAARVHFNNGAMKLPIGSSVTARIFAAPKKAYWLPKEAVLSLGRDKIVFIKEAGGFQAQKISTGMERNRKVQILTGLEKTDSVAANAQFLADNEAFIKPGKP